MRASSRVKRDDRGITNYDIRSVGGESEEIYLFPREALIQMLKAMRAQDKKEAQAAQAQDRVRLFGHSKVAAILRILNFFASFLEGKTVVVFRLKS